MPILPTGTVTFLFTDIEGSTKLWEQQPDAMRLALARHDRMLHQAITGHDGFVFKTVGDSFCAAFSNAGQALQAALEAQRSFAAEPWPLPAVLAVRMALHTGACDERGGDYFGPPLSRVARLMSAGYGGQTLLSSAAQELTRDALPAGAALRDLGQHRLKDLTRPEQVFQLLHPTLPADFPPLRTLDNPALRNNLPRQVSSFVGRETQLAQVKALAEKSRLLTLTGAGGSGKTRLSLQAAADLLDGSGDGVWLVELASITDPALVPQAVARALSVREEAGKSMEATLVEALQHKRLLLILDNCEHLITACAVLTETLLHSCPNVHILASSREPLGVPGEQIYRVPSLSLPDPRQAQTMDSLAQYEAVRLFIERAQAVQPDFAVSNANAPAVAQVCWRLDGIPMAIELAAARIRSLPVEEINTRLGSRFQLLTGGSRTVLPRQQTLRALVDWSYDLLTPGEKTLLCRLSVFAGGWTLPAAESVGTGEDIEEWQVLDLLTGLVDKSLAVYEVGEAGGRYRYLETIREYAGERLAERGGMESARQKAAAWFLHLAEEAELHLSGPMQQDRLSRLETEHDNLQASLAWYEESAGTPSAAEDLRLAGALCRFWAVRGHYAEGRQWLGTILGNAPNAEPSMARARAFFGAGYLAYNQGDFGAARAMYEQSLALYRLLGKPENVATMLDNLGNVFYEQGDYAAARALYEQSLMLQRERDSQRGIASSLGNLGNVAHEQKDYGGARALHEECLSIQRGFGDLRGIANSLNNLGNTAHAQGDYAGADALHQESLTLQRQLGNQRGIANSLSNLGILALAQSRGELARDLFKQSLTIRHGLGDQKGIVFDLEGMAALASGQAQPAQTARLLGAASLLRQHIGCPLSPAEQEEIDTHLSGARTALGDSAFSEAWNAGQAMTLEQTVEYALSTE